MSGIVAWFARNAVAANLLMIVAFVGGVFGYTKMEQEMFPVVNVAGASVSVAWNGASPQDVEEQIVTRIEEAVADINGLDRITSIANEGFGVVNIKGRKSHKLVQLRNPWGDTGWTGTWGVQDLVWQKRPRLAKEMGVEIGNEASKNNSHTFWLEFDVFIERFNTVW